MDNYPNFINYDNNQDAFASKIDINLDEPDLYQIPERNLGEDPFSQSLHPSRLLNYGADPLSSLFEQEPTANANKLDYQQSSTSNVFELEAKREESDSEQTESVADPMSVKSKRILKREKAKQRAQARAPKITEDTLFTGDIPAKYIPEGFYNPDVDEKTKKKMLQMVRNRISAQNSRDRKKQQAQHLEEKNNELKQENFGLKNRVNEQDEIIKALRKENEELKNSLINALRSKDTEHLQNDTLRSDVLQNDLFGHSDRDTQHTGESPNLSGRTSPIMRRHFQSGGFMKYSLALATIFAVVMFTGVNSPPGSTSMNSIAAIPQHSTALQVPIKRMYASRGRMLQEIEPEDEQFDDKEDMKDIQIKMEEEKEPEDTDLNDKPCKSTDLAEYPFIKELSFLQENFNEQYMSKFFSQLKIKDSIVVRDEKKLSKALDVRRERPEEGNGYNFPTYLRASRKQLPNYSETKETNENQLALSFGPRTFKESTNNDGISSLFCPSGYEFQSEDDDTVIRMNGQGQPNRRKLKLQDSEWLQLFVPKSNVSIATMSAQNEFFVSPSLNQESDDNTMLEVWCKVFFVRELPSGL